MSSNESLYSRSESSLLTDADTGVAVVVGDPPAAAPPAAGSGAAAAADSSARLYFLKSAM